MKTVCIDINCSFVLEWHIAFSGLNIVFKARAVTRAVTRSEKAMGSWPVLRLPFLFRFLWWLLVFWLVLMFLSDGVLSWDCTYYLLIQINVWWRIGEDWLVCRRHLLSTVIDTVRNRSHLESIVQGIEFIFRYCFILMKRRPVTGLELTG